RPPPEGWSVRLLPADDSPGSCASRDERLRLRDAGGGIIGGVPRRSLMAVRASAPTKRSTQRKDPQQAAVVELLNQHVAVAADLYSQLKQAHWTVVGHEFIAVHELFDKQADVALAHLDLFAERIRALQGIPAGTVRVS